jgi:predicted TIM-barrel fold metal-dependent hydrolase
LLIDPKHHFYEKELSESSDERYLYLKVATSAQMKAAFNSGLRLPWSITGNNINILTADVRYEQAFIKQISSDKRILSTIDSTTSIVMSSKLAYQLAKISD